MRKHEIGSMVAGVAAAIALLSLGPKSAAGQSATEPIGSGIYLTNDEAKAKVPTAPAPRLPDGRPDFS